MARYGRKSRSTVKSAMHRMKRGELKSGRGGKGGTVKSRKQAIAIGLNEAREKGEKVPAAKSSSRSRRHTGGRRKSTSRGTSSTSRSTRASRSPHASRTSRTGRSSRRRSSRSSHTSRSRSSRSS